jgi:hypothetical protein
MIKKFRKKPVVIEAIQLSEQKLETIFDFIGERKNYPECKIGGINPATGSFTLRTLEGDHIALIGDWIIKGVKGEFYPCKPDIFELTYEEVEEKGCEENDEVS